MLSPIQTRRHWIKAIDFDSSVETAEQSKFKADLTLAHKKCKDHWHVKLSFRFGGDGKDTPRNYKGKIDFEGIFDVHPDYPEEKREELVRMNGGAVLYGAVRELILNLSSRSKHGPFEIPTIDARIFLKPPKSKEKPPLKD